MHTLIITLPRHGQSYSNTNGGIRHALQEILPENSNLEHDGDFTTALCYSKPLRKPMLG
jgi:hypothetical protein